MRKTGGDDLNQLCDANEEEFKEIVDLVGMSSKPLHVKRLRKAIDEHRLVLKKGNSNKLVLIISFAFDLDYNVFT